MARNAAAECNTRLTPPGTDFTGKVSAAVLLRMDQGCAGEAPGEYQDIYHRPVLIDLDGGTELPLNLPRQGDDLLVRINGQAHNVDVHAAQSMRARWRMSAARATASIPPLPGIGQ